MATNTVLSFIAVHRAAAVFIFGAVPARNVNFTLIGSIGNKVVKTLEKNFSLKGAC